MPRCRNCHRKAVIWIHNGYRWILCDRATTWLRPCSMGPDKVLTRQGDEITGVRIPKQEPGAVFGHRPHARTCRKAPRKAPAPCAADRAAGNT